MGRDPRKYMSLSGCLHRLHRTGEVIQEEWRVGREEGSDQHLVEDRSLDQGFSTSALLAFGAR